MWGAIRCGLGNKELTLLEHDIVQEFLCFDLSAEGIARARENTESKGLSERISFINEDFFTSKYANETYDMVYWDNSLHHMMDAKAAEIFMYIL